ncbi:hypothetical protein Poly41_27170 [Novipirellula artificiosorum]|uniref:Uncharacterized protein n=1 Tax=Novipirellula artificiosorum TaxID=2528016 RepID=A0A5C6DRR5_9BACT|nr:hypothetical protein Poly41_27170 [Novipirellula artificiosorum]
MLAELGEILSMDVVLPIDDAAAGSAKQETQYIRWGAAR